MLTISTDSLPQTCLSYFAFRVSFRETLERISLAKQIGEDSLGRFGYLTEVPFLAAIPPQVQLDLLADTWSKHLSPEHFEADLVDEGVVYAVCETSARIVEREPALATQFLEGGPLDVAVAADHFLASELRNLHLNLSNDGDFLLISQFEDLPPEEASRMKSELGLDEERFEPMFDVLSRWYMSADFIANLQGLFHDREIAQAISIIGLRTQPLC